MSRSHDHRARNAELASDLAAALATAIDDNRLDDVSDEALGQIFASVVRFYSARAQAGGSPPRPFARNSGVTATDAMIGCTAMLEGVNVSLFDLSVWQSWSALGRQQPAENGDLVEI